MSQISYSRAASLSLQAEGRPAFYTGKTVNATKASRTNVSEDATSVSTVATSTLQIGSVMCRDPYGHDKGIGVDFTRPATAVLHEQKVVVVALGDRAYPDSISTDGPGRWCTVVDMTGEVNVLIQDGSVTTPTTGLDGSILGVVNGSFALADIDFPAAAGAGFTDSTGGTASATLAAASCLDTIYLPLGPMASLVTAVSLTKAMAYAFTANSVLFRADQPITTGGKAVTLQARINTTNMTGGAVAVSGAYATAATQAGSAITAANTGVVGDLLGVLTSAITAFSEGSGHVEFNVTNLSLANAIASLAAGANRLKQVLLTGVAVPLDPALAATNLSGTAAAVKRCRVGLFGTIKVMP
jgi:hypothetical protein